MKPVLLPKSLYEDAKKAGFDMRGYAIVPQIPASLPKKPIFKAAAK